MAQLTREQGEWEREEEMVKGGGKEKKGGGGGGEGGADWKQISSPKISTPPHVSPTTVEWSQTAFSSKLLRALKKKQNKDNKRLYA